VTGVTLWFTGLSGAGKTTLAEAIGARLRAAGRKTELLDGDVVRTHLSKGLGFSRGDRDTNILRIAFVAELLTRNDVCVIVAAISPYRETRNRARQMIGRFVEIHVATPLDECIRRDSKGLYAKALRGEIREFTGVSDPYEAPERPEIALDTTGLTVEACVETIEVRLRELGHLAR
jgi:adenylyl-sulfate kinase